MECAKRRTAAVDDNVSDDELNVGKDTVNLFGPTVDWVGRPSWSLVWSSVQHGGLTEFRRYKYSTCTYAVQCPTPSP